jgi:CubicO group peptidase (beta-lactamase class C family)
MKKLSFLLAILFVSYYLIAQEPKLPVFITDSLENYIERGMKLWKIPALSVAIVKDGKVVFMKGYGVTKIGGKEPVDENTLFMIGSNTKAFTATTLAILQEEGKCNLNDKVQKWMPEFKLKDSCNTKMITIADLLSHHIGFETFQGDFTYWTSNLSREEVIQKMALIDAPYDFRTTYGYCNAAFLTAGELIPRIIGKSWEETVREKILNPLKMNRTLLLYDEFKAASNAALPYVIIDDKLIEIPIPNCDNLAPAASICSSANDMAIWLQAQLNNGNIDSIQVLSSQVIQAIRNPKTILGIDTEENVYTHFYLYGMGLGIQDRKGKLVYSHDGGVDGYFSKVLFVPEEKFGIVVLTNTNLNWFYWYLTSEIRDAFLDIPYQNFSDSTFIIHLNEETQKKAKMDSLISIVKANNKPNLPLSSYAGTYSNDVYGDIEIKLAKNGLNIHFSHHPNLIGKLEFLNNDTSFLCTYSNPIMGIKEIPFKIENNAVTGLTLHVDDFVEFTPYKFIRRK